MKKIVFATIAMFIFTFCSTWFTKLILVNNTQNRIFYDFGVMNIKDTLPPSLQYCNETKLYTVESLSEERLLLQNNLELLKDQSEFVFRLYIIEEDTLKKYRLCDVCQNSNLYKRIDLTYDDLVKAIWRVEYNGMK